MRRRVGPLKRFAPKRLIGDRDARGIIRLLRERYRPKDVLVFPTALEGLARPERQRSVEVEGPGAGDGYRAWTDTDPRQRRHPPHQFFLQQRGRVL